MNNSPLILSILAGKMCMELPNGFVVSGMRRHFLLCMLVDGIYPDWSIFIGPKHATTNRKEERMTKRQEAIRKDVERFFGYVQGRFKILRQELFEWSDEQIVLISNVCVIFIISWLAWLVITNF